MKVFLLWVYFALRAMQKIGDKILSILLVNYIKCKAASCGRDLQVSGWGRFMCVEGLQVGDNVGVNSGAYWVCEGGLTIGRNCRFGRNSTVYTRNHNYKGNRLPFDDANIFKPVEIGDNVWIGVNVTILPGTVIEEGAIVGGGSVVFGRVPAGSIVGVHGAKKFGTRDMDHYFNLSNAD